VLREQRLEPRLASPEFDEQFHRGAAAALREDGVAKAPGDVGIGQPFFLERAEGVGRQHFGPLVAVVARRIAAREDVRKAVRKAVPGRPYILSGVPQADMIRRYRLQSAVSIGIAAVAAGVLLTALVSQGFIQ